MAKLIEFYENKTIPETDEIRIRINSVFGTTGMGISGNTNFTMIHAEDVNVLAGGVVWRTAQDKAANRNEIDIRHAEEKMLAFQKLLKVYAVEANRQHGGTSVLADEVALETTGMTLAKPGEEVGQMDQAVITTIEAVKGVTGRAKITVQTSKKYCHGTYVEITEVVSGEVTIEHSTDKHIVIIDGMKHGKDYQVRVCYDGTDKTRVWSDPKPFTAV